jgi:hypothetical protein
MSKVGIDLARQQCFNHPGREAIVRCPSCHRDFCRECVTEHDDRYLCSACLRAQAGEEANKSSPRRRRFPTGAFMALAGLLTAWLVYYASAQYLVLRSNADQSYRVWHAR